MQINWHSTFSFPLHAMIFTILFDCLPDDMKTNEGNTQKRVLHQLAGMMSSVCEVEWRMRDEILFSRFAACSQICGALVFKKALPARDEKMSVAETLRKM